MPSEDVQPNELRLSRKGNTNVPLVRTSRPRGAPRGHTRGFAPRGRGNYANGYTGRGSSPSATYTNPPRTPHHSHASTSSSSRHDSSYSYSITSTRFSGGAFKHERHPFTHKREHSINTDAHGPPHKVFRAAENALHDKPQYRNFFHRPSGPKRQELILDLPDNCHEGSPYCRYNREQWVRDNIYRIAVERGINIISHQFYGRNQVKLFYYPLPGCGPSVSTTSTPDGAQTACGGPSAVLPVDEQKPFHSPPYRKIEHAYTYPANRDSLSKPATTAHDGKPTVKEEDAPQATSSKLLQDQSADAYNRIPRSTHAPSVKCAVAPWHKTLPSPATEQSSTQAVPVIRHATADMAPAPPHPPLTPVLQSTTAPRGKVHQAEVIDLTLSSDDDPHQEPAMSVVSTIARNGSHRPIEPQRHGASPPSDSSPADTQPVHVVTSRCLSATSGTFTLGRDYEIKDLKCTSKLLVNPGVVLPASREPPASPENTPQPDSAGVADPSNTHVPPPCPTMQDPTASLDGQPGWDAVSPDDDSSQVSEVDELEQDVISLRSAKNTHDKPRRLLTGASRGLIAVSMRGAVELVSWEHRRRRTLVEASDHTGDIVDDACLLQTVDDKTYAILAHDRGHKQLSLVCIRGPNKVVSPIFLDRPADKTSSNAAASAICAMLQPGMFATGGYDHRVHLWEVPENVSKATARELAIRHTSCVHTLLPVRDVSRKLVTAGADCRVNVYELASERVVNAFKVSNPVYHLHDAGLPYSVLLEVAHRELQFEIRDYRLVPERPVQRFGFDTELLLGRHAKGDINNFIFACGDREGNVRLWDIRKSDKPLSTVNYFPGRRTMQVAFRGEGLVACSDDFQVKFIDPAEVASQ